MQGKWLERFFFAWGSSGGFVAGAALAALVLKEMKVWPVAEAYLRRFKSSGKAKPHV